MTPLEALKQISEFTEKNIAPKILMRKEVKHSGDIMDNTKKEPEYVHPAVCYGTIPHKNFQPLDFQCPMILWTFDTVDDHGTYDSGRLVGFRANISAYTSGMYEEDSKLPDNKAFVDLANLLEIMYEEITKSHLLNGVGREKPISYGIYDGAYYPYAYGYFTFTAELTRMHYDENNIDLDEIC